MTQLQADSEGHPAVTEVQQIFFDSSDDVLKAGAPSEKRMMSTSRPDFSVWEIAIRQRLNDPEQRKQLRAEQRASIVRNNPDLAQVLRIEPALEAKLIELLTDRQMQHLERIYTKRASRKFLQNAQMLAEDETQVLTKLKKLLGENRFEQYQDYKSTVTERRMCNRFNARLDSSSKLSAEQKERLIQLLHDKQQRESVHPLANLINLLPQSNSADPVERRKEKDKRRIRHSEEALWRMQEANRQLLKRLEQVLTPQQLDVFAQMKEEKIDSQRLHIQQMRVQAGMSPESEVRQPEPPSPTRKPVTGQVSLEVNLRVNKSEPVEVVLRIGNGETVPFEGPEGLWVEATPTLFEDGWHHIVFQFFEGDRQRRRAIGGSMRMGGQSSPDQGQLGRGGGGGTIITGSKGYAVLVEANVSKVVGIKD